MNFAEMIYKLSTFFFSNLWTYLGLLILIITIRGDVTKAILGINKFFKGVMAKYRAKVEAQKLFNTERQKFTNENKAYTKP